MFPWKYIFMAIQAAQEPTISRPCVLHVIVVGAGLAGLAAAISMRLEGHRVTILEKSPKLQEVGAKTPNYPKRVPSFPKMGHL